MKSFAIVLILVFIFNCVIAIEKNQDKHYEINDDNDIKLYCPENYDIIDNGETISIIINKKTISDIQIIFILIAEDLGFNNEMILFDRDIAKFITTYDSIMNFIIKLLRTCADKTQIVLDSETCININGNTLVSAMRGSAELLNLIFNFI